jgi:fluoroquinolone transport system ATP-binding protein
MITVEHLYHDYSGKGTYAVNDVSFTIDEGEIFGFLGPSGAGKSTVQGIMTGLLSIQKGEVAYGTESVRTIGNAFFNKIGVSFEHPNLYNKLTGLENLQYYAGLFKVPTQDPMLLLERVGLAEHAHKRAGSYSKGMKQRLVFCRSLLNNPAILFLDEPTSGLDPSTAEVIKAMIREQSERGSTVFLTTHNMFTADQLCNRVAFINEGVVVAMDEPKKLKLKYGEDAVEVDYEENGTSTTEVFSLSSDEQREQFHTVVDTKRIRTIHTLEATLEQIFIKLTGRGLE